MLHQQFCLFCEFYISYWSAFKLVLFLSADSFKWVKKNIWKEMLMQSFILFSKGNSKTFSWHTFKPQFHIFVARTYYTGYSWHVMLGISHFLIVKQGTMRDVSLKFIVTTKESMVLDHFECCHFINSALIFSIHINNKKWGMYFPQEWREKRLPKNKIYHIISVVDWLCF